MTCYSPRLGRGTKPYLQSVGHQHSYAYHDTGIRRRDGGHMSTVDYRIRWVASSIATLMQEWPELTWTDVQGLNRHVGFSHRTASDGYLGVAGVGTGGSKLRKADLQAAWNLAREMSRKEIA